MAIAALVGLALALGWAVTRQRERTTFSRELRLALKDECAAVQELLRQLRSERAALRQELDEYRRLSESLSAKSPSSKVQPSPMKPDLRAEGWHQVPPSGSAASMRELDPPDPAEESLAGVYSLHFQKVLRLAALGYDVIEIARSLGMGRGEVALVLELAARDGTKGGRQRTV